MYSEGYIKKMSSKRSLPVVLISSAICLSSVCCAPLSVYASENVIGAASTTVSSDCCSQAQDELVTIQQSAYPVISDKSGMSTGTKICVVFGAMLCVVGGGVMFFVIPVAYMIGGAIASVGSILVVVGGVSYKHGMKVVRIEVAGSDMQTDVSSIQEMIDAMGMKAYAVSGSKPVQTLDDSVQQATSDDSDDEDDTRSIHTVDDTLNPNIAANVGSTPTIGVTTSMGIVPGAVDTVETTATAASNQDLQSVVPSVGSSVLGITNDDVLRAVKESNITFIRDNIDYIKNNAGTIRDGDDKTPLMYAAEKGHLDIVKLLVDYEKGLSDKGGKTALMYAAEKGHLDIVKLYS